MVIYPNRMEQKLYIPTKVFFTKGVGRHKDYLSSFETAIRNAGIEICNLVSVSSIYPPGCKIISKQQGLKELNKFLIEKIFRFNNRKGDLYDQIMILLKVADNIPHH